MKICLVAPRIGKTKGAFIGGSTNSVINLSRELAKKHEVHLVTSPPVGVHQVEGIDWCHVHQLNIKANANSLWYGFEFVAKTVRKIKELHEDERFDVINTHSGSPKLGLISGLMGKICNIPSIHSLYSPIIPPSEVDVERHKFFSNYRFLSNPQFSKIYLSQLDYIICISKNVALSVRKVLTDKRIKIIPPCVDVARFAPFSPDFMNIKKELGLRDEKIISFVGERKSKGIEILIEAIRRLRGRVDAKFIIIAGLEKENLKEKIKGIEDSVILLDVVEMSSILRITDVFVAPILSSFDISDIPLSVLEAMSAGKPVIGTKIGGLLEIINHEVNGVLIERHVGALVEALISLLEDEKKREELGKNAYQFVKENFSMEKIARMYTAIYQEALNVKCEKQ